jgi:hypothetical protein
VKILNNRLVAFLDVLGFSRLLETKALNEVHEQYSSFIDQAKTMTFYQTVGDNTGRTNFTFAQFLSDSLVVVSNEIDDVYNVNSFIAAIHYLLEIGFINRLPLRGAIGKGDFLVDDDRNIFMSKCLPSLVRLEGEQDWSGCVIMEDCENIILENIFGKCRREDFSGLQLRNNQIHLVDVPLKNGNRKMFAINYLFFLTEQQILDGIEYLIEPKKTNAKEYFNFLKNTPVEMQKLPNDFLPATDIKVMKTRSGMRTMFLDKDGSPCKPGVDQFQWVAVGRWKE